MEIQVAPAPEHIVQQQQQELDPRRWLMLVVVLCATLMGGLDFFIVNVAMPSIQQELHASFAEVQLIVAGYTLAYAVLLVTGGRLGDLYGRKRLFLIGVSGFTLFSALCGFAPNAVLLIVFRIAQGGLAALMAPQVIAFIQVSFGPDERQRAFSGYTTTMGLASILGQVIGGALVQANILGTGWRSIFLVNLPIGLVTLLAASLLVRESRLHGARNLDYGGVALLTITLFLLIFPLVQGSSMGWPLWALICLVLSVPSMILFIAYEQRMTRQGRLPLVSLALFRQPRFTGGNLTVLLNGMLFSPFLLILAFYLQGGLRLSPLDSGLVVMSASCSFMIASNVTPAIVRRIDNRTLFIAAGLAVLGYALIMLMAQWVVPVWGIVPLLVALFVMGFGQGLLITPLMNKTLEGVTLDDVGTASGIYTTVFQTSGSFGIAIIGMIYAAIVASSGSALHAFVISLLIIAVVSLSQFFTLQPFRAGRRRLAGERI